VIWRLLARTVAGAHLAYAAFVMFGSLVVLAWPRLIWLHLFAVFWSAATLIFDLGCPMTPWEKQLWMKGGASPYEEGFVQHYILRPFSNPVHERRNHVIAGTLIVVVNAIVYLAVFYRARG
jgi:hypothetical protein